MDESQFPKNGAKGKIQRDFAGRTTCLGELVQHLSFTSKFVYHGLTDVARTCTIPQLHVMPSGQVSWPEGLIKAKVVTVTYSFIIVYHHWFMGKKSIRFQYFVKEKWWNSSVFSKEKSNWKMTGAVLVDLFSTWKRPEVRYFLGLATARLGDSTQCPQHRTGSGTQKLSFGGFQNHF